MSFKEYIMTEIISFVKVIYPISIKKSHLEYI